MPPVSASLESFLAPASIAVIGASPETTRIRGALLHLLRRNAYPGRLYAVNPSYSDIDGVPCFPSVAAIGAPVDLALVAIPAAAVPQALEECAAAKVAHAVVISSGFAEEGGARSGLQNEVAAIARRTGMRVSGPNGEGFHNEIGRVAATFSPAVDPKPGEEAAPRTGRRIGIVAQSGGVGFALYNRGRALGLDFSYVVTTGNEADLSVADFLDYMVDDPQTGVVVLFIESVRNPALFLAAAARAAALGKPVVAMKIGRSQAGLRAAASHTASMAGWDVAYDAVFRKFGFLEADDPDEAMAIAGALATGPVARGRRAAVVTVSGGAGAWVADTLAAAELDLPVLGDELQQTIRGFIPSYGSPANPVDITAQAVHTGGLLRALDLLIRSDEVDLVVVTVSLSNENRMSIDVAALTEMLRTAPKPVLFFSYTIPSALARRVFAGAGAIIHTGLATLGSAARELVRGGGFRAPAATLDALPDAVVRTIRSMLARAKGPLCEYEAKELLVKAGLAMPRSALASGTAALKLAASEIGFPLALKIQSPDLPHKTEIGGVALRLADVGSVQRAYAAMLERVTAARPEARLRGVLVERMARPGIEVIVGAIRDEVWGPLVMVGAGGIATELFKDIVYRPAPIDAATAREMIAGLKSAKLLDGFRGAAPADLEALARIVARVSAFAAAFRGEIREVELNPVIVHEKGAGCTVADALVVLA